MVKRGPKRKGVCKTTAKVTGNHVTVKTTCPVKPRIIKAPCEPRKKYTKQPVPRVCKGLRGRALKECKRLARKEYRV